MSFEQSIKFHTLDTREEEKHNQKPSIHTHTHTHPHKTCCGHPLARVGRRSSATKPREGRPSQAKTPGPVVASLSFPPLMCALFHPPRTHTLKRRPVRRKLENALISSLPLFHPTPNPSSLCPGKTHTYFSRRTLVSLPGRPSSLVRSLLNHITPASQPRSSNGIPCAGSRAEQLPTRHTSPRNVARAAVVPRKTMVVHPRTWDVSSSSSAWKPHVT